MTETRPGWQTLNAYVDGELRAAEAAAVARALAEDRELAGRVAALAALKAAAHDTAEPAGLTLPAPRRRAWRPLAAAALLVAVLTAGLAAVYLPWSGSGPPAWLSAARAVHEHWLGREARPPAAPLDSGLVLARLNLLGPDALVPDLAPARLSLGRLEAVTVVGLGPGLHAGYRGTRGCRVSLLVLAGGAALPHPLSRYTDGALTAYAWRGGRLGYLIMALGMDPERLRTIAETVHRASLERRRFDAETRSVLRRSREASMPCLA